MYLALLLFLLLPEETKWVDSGAFACQTLGLHLAIHDSACRLFPKDHSLSFTIPPLIPREAKSKTLEPESALS